jgi:hypothetical protein
MAVAVLAFGNTALLLSNDANRNGTHFDGYDKVLTALYTSYKALVLVDFDELVDDGTYTTLTRLLFVLSTLMTSVVLLNLLIARMNVLRRLTLGFAQQPAGLQPERYIILTALMVPF